MELTDHKEVEVVEEMEEEVMATPLGTWVGWWPPVHQGEDVHPSRPTYVRSGETYYFIFYILHFVHIFFGGLFFFLNANHINKCGPYEKRNVCQVGQVQSDTQVPWDF